jgi:hypothetical protein
MTITLRIRQQFPHKPQADRTCKKNGRVVTWHNSQPSLQRQWVWFCSYQYTRSMWRTMWQLSTLQIGLTPPPDRGRMGYSHQAIKMNTTSFRFVGYSLLFFILYIIHPEIPLKHLWSYVNTMQWCLVWHNHSQAMCICSRLLSRRCLGCNKDMLSMFSFVLLTEEAISGSIQILCK